MEWRKEGRILNIDSSVIRYTTFAYFCLKTKANLKISRWIFKMRCTFHFDRKY